MGNLEHIQPEVIRDRVGANFFAQDRVKRREEFSLQKIAISIESSDFSESLFLRREEEKKLNVFRSPVVNTYDLYAALLLAVRSFGQETMPYDDYPNRQSLVDAKLEKTVEKNIITAQRQAMELARKVLEIQVEDGRVNYYLLQSPNEFDQRCCINQQIEDLLQQSPECVDRFHHHQAVMHETIKILKELSDDETCGIVMLIDSPSQAPKDFHNLVLHTRSDIPTSWVRMSDRIIEPSKTTNGHYQILCNTAELTHFRSQRIKLAEQQRNNEILLEPEFTQDNWPHHPLLSSMKRQLDVVVKDFLSRGDRICDLQDLRYQVAFRLTTFPLRLVYQRGDELKQILSEYGVYDDWRAIPHLPEELVNAFELSPTILETVLDEQYAIIENRLTHSPLPVREILTPSGIFAENNWVLKKEGGFAFAAHALTGEKRNVHFGIVPNEIATAYHHAFHYIHTPRSYRAYGLWLEGEALPFSVLAIEPVDRDYKKNLLLMHGYDPTKCIDLARLYSKPGAPFNSSSVIFSLVFAEMRMSHPETQAVLSAFMPSWATGKSMLSGGFDHPVLIKPNKHTFGKTTLPNGTVAYEHLTKRRRNGVSEEDYIGIHPDFPMLPVVELMSPLQPPRFSPNPAVIGNMVVCQT